VPHPRRVGDPSADRYEAALSQLPEAYAQALRLRDAGMSEATICQHLQIELEGLDMLMAVADEKLAAELHRTSRS
jgi:DNA-directed RNA polymerase specialized sigma24 family protein